MMMLMMMTVTTITARPRVLPVPLTFLFEKYTSQKKKANISKNAITGTLQIDRQMDRQITCHQFTDQKCFVNQPIIVNLLVKQTHKKH